MLQSTAACTSVVSDYTFGNVLEMHKKSKLTKRLTKINGFHLPSVKAKEKSSDAQWLRSVVSSGTLKDKVAALTIQVQVSGLSVTFLMRQI